VERRHELAVSAASRDPDAAAGASVVGCGSVRTNGRGCARAVLALADGDIETRVPKEFLWVDNRFRQGVFVVDVEAETMWNIRLSAASTRHPDWGRRL
jgi:hypothetical protein